MRRDLDRIADILEAAEKIRVRVARGRERFDSDEDLQIVLTHLVQVIGEAASKVGPDVTAAYPSIPWREMAGMRNRVVHEYFAVDLEVLWSAVSRDVPRIADVLGSFAADDD